MAFINKIVDTSGKLIELKEFLSSSKGRDILLYLVFVIISLAFWAILSLNNLIQDNYKVMFRITGIPQGVTMINDYPREFNVTVKNNGYVLLKYMIGDNPEITVDDIDTELLYQTLHDGIGSRRIHASAMTLQDPAKIMLKLGVARKDGMILNAANVLFGKEPTLLHTQCKIRLARFEGIDKREFRDQTVCEGNLFEQYDAVMDFCLKHLNLSGRMDSKFRQDTLTVPYEAIKEATINMLCHRSWNAENTTPSLAIYDDRIVFQNPGAFPHGMSWQDFVDDQIGSLPANPTIANVFYRRGTMEAWGRGIGLIMKSCREQELPVPEIRVVAPFVNLTIWFRRTLTEATNKPAFKIDDADTPSHTPSDDGFTPSQVSYHPKSSLVSPQDKVFEFCKSPKSIVEIANMLGVNDRRWVRKKYIAPFIGTRLQMTIPDKPNSQNQKYKTIE